VQQRRKRNGTIGAAFFAALLLFGTVATASAAAPPDTSGTSDANGAADETTPGEAGAFAVRPWSTDASSGRDYFIYTLKAGALYGDKVTISNDSDQKATYAVYATDAVNTNDGSFSLLREEEKPKDLGTWVELGATQYTLQPHTEVTIPFSVTVPADAISGDHVGAIVAQKINDPSNPNGIGLNVRVRVGARIYVRIDGATNPSLAIDSFNLQYDTPANPFGGNAARVSYVLTNTGNVRLSPKAALKLSGVFGMGERRFPDRQIPELLPGGSITISEVLLDVKPWVRLTADLDVQSPDDAVAVRASIDQWAIPTGLLVAVAVVLAALILWRIIARRRRNATA
jgi:hypothetical protein